MAKSRDELIHELAREGLRKLMMTNLQTQARIEQARMKLAEKQADEMLAKDILGDPLKEEEEILRAKAQHRAYMKAQREKSGEEDAFAPIEVDSYMERNRR
jgi:hypothetical protein